MEKITKLILPFLLFCLISTASASSEWTLTGCTELKKCSLPCGSQTVSIIDFNDDAVLIDVFEGGNVTDTVLVSLSSSELFNNDMAKVSYYLTNGAKRRVAVYTRNVPRFTVSTESRQSGNYYISDITIKCLNQDAKNVKISMDSENVKFRKEFRDLRYWSITEDTEIEKSIKYKLLPNPSIIINIEWEDGAGNEYNKEFDILKNVEINKPAIEKNEQKSPGYTIIRNSAEDREKKIFYRAIERALNHIDFSEEVENELRSIMEKLTQ